MNVFKMYGWQRGPLLGCGYAAAYPLCVADNLLHMAYSARLRARRATGWRWLCRRVPMREGWLCAAHYQVVNWAALRDDA